MSKQNPKSTSRSLTEFAQEYEARPRGKPCFLCGLPEREEMDAARNAGVGVTAIREWLIQERDYKPEEVTVSRLSGHFHKSKHHLQQ